MKQQFTTTRIRRNRKNRWTHTWQTCKHGTTLLTFTTSSRVSSKLLQTSFPCMLPMPRCPLSWTMSYRLNTRYFSLSSILLAFSRARPKTTKLSIRCWNCFLACRIYQVMTYVNSRIQICLLAISSITYFRNSFRKKIRT
mgnify:CR=1 FL=1